MVKSSLKPSKGSNRAHLSPSRTSTGAMMRRKRLGASCSTMPADCSRKTNGPALPSMIGISGPATSTCRLSMPRPASADMTCSTVEMLAPSTFSVDDSRVSPTWWALAGSSDRSGQVGAMEHDAGVRRGAGRSPSSTRAPVWRPTPVVLIGVLSVRCFSMTCIPSDPALRVAAAGGGSKRFSLWLNGLAVNSTTSRGPRARAGAAGRAAGSAPAACRSPRRAPGRPCPVSRPACAGTPGSRQGRTPVPSRARRAPAAG